ncbi:MAG TPA: peptide chain release factor 3 [Phycisphaerae bacterium]|nr:peptide chain release factor 3 [Phycisphaerae bacterium]HOJ75140.1 peptide chain release factor 3 [Phycisphaerae bacterium]HOM52370.1 peptide chain release factor 3 [Phycisphaerae bacterium]HON64949.1 peptide chain release factor 3 [Phycisphaerae bacterium]HPP27457.1 peptide chain release factor 3 [Phycisphaerae bacterium]
MINEITRRRTFAIISHPDAGKTTLTEKFLLYGGALQLAGSVTARKNQRAATSDWMELERQRGISITSTVLQFDYAGYRVNLLDTPGHKDFSEDTYRVLTAVDAVVMVIDAGKGIESQTQKLFEICRRRGIPIFTFMNKVDRPTLEPLALLDELERVLGIQAVAMNWPLESGGQFKGLYDRMERRVHFFERVPGGAYRAPVTVHSLADDVVRSRLSDDVYENLVTTLAMLDEAGASFNADAVLAGELTPVFFGSAVNNFGVQLLLDAVLEYSSPPRPRRSADTTIRVDDPRFSGFIFKIQANMDPRHRDRVAFLRVCSGRFERDMTVLHARTGKKIRLSSSHKLFAQERETVDEAWPGDVIGLVGHAEFAIGDTLTTDRSIVYDEIPSFAPEVFAYLHSTSAAQYKRFRAGLDQLLQEGVVQSLQLREPGQRAPLLAAVGPLQFEVVQYRLSSEFGAESRLEPAGWELMRWVSPAISEAMLAAASLPSGVQLATDAQNQPVILFPSKWSLDYFIKQNPDIAMSDLPYVSRYGNAAPQTMTS